MKPDFTQMTRKELKAYVLVNREDDEAISEIISRVDLNAPGYSTTDPEELKKIFNDQIEKLRQQEEDE
ncbi:MAG: hypothetical protein HC860_09075 [Alkalinema sp. RU_4_3]|nr:hypothetical protein [Alkalinema sp. RU_4_3]